jgi:hypothetical protein
MQTNETKTDEKPAITEPDQPEKTGTIIEDSIKNTEKTVDNTDIDYAQAFPDGALSPEAIQEKITLFKTHNVSVDAAKVIVSDMISAVENAIKMTIDTQNEKFKADRAAEVKQMADKTQAVLGAELDKMKPFIPLGLNKYLDREEADSFLQFCAETGIGNDHRLIRLLSNIGKAASEDKPSTGDAPKPKQPRYPGSGLDY